MKKIPLAVITKKMGFSCLLVICFALCSCSSQKSVLPGKTESNTTSDLERAEANFEQATLDSSEPEKEENLPATANLDSEIETQISALDQMVMVYVEPGEFQLGSEKGVGEVDEEPQHNVKLKGFWIDQTEVTNRMYEKCVNMEACTEPANAFSYSHEDYFGNPEFSDYPVIYVNWYQAESYCRWAGRRLPTEAEWEVTAKGKQNFLYPWGNNEPDITLANYEYAFDDNSRVGSFPDGASPYGALDMAGNVAEWVSDWYGPYSQSEEINPQGPVSGEYHITRGGSWVMSEYLIRTSERYWASVYYNNDDVGFRCAQSLK